MRRLLIGIAVLVGVGLSAVSASASHLEFFWNRNTESDMASYRLYRSPVTPCVAATNVLVGTVPQPAAGVQPTLDVPHGQQGFACVTAVDLGGNESGVSNTIPFDAAAPVVPGGLGVRVK